MRTERKFFLLCLTPLLLIATPGCCCLDDDEVSTEYPESVTDVDGNVYDVVVIGDQAWMAENLRVSKYQNGDPITVGPSDRSEWMALEEGAYSVYPHDEVDGIHSEEEMIGIYGKLYNWYAVDDSRGICPPGWHVPSEAEIIALTDYIRENVQEENVGNILRSCRQINSPLGGACDTEEHPRWLEDPEVFGTDELGFSALPAGRRDRRFGFDGIGYWWFMWTGTEYDEEKAVNRRMRHNSGSVWDLDPSHKYNGESVRCIWSGATR